MGAAVADQFVHGYEDGHRLLASSRTLPPEVGRRLLIHSDTPAAQDGHRLVATMPIPEMDAWALTGTWPAPEMPRPGSVWSHTLLIDLESIRQLSSAMPLLRALHRPDGDLSSFRIPVSLASSQVEPSPPAAAPVGLVATGLAFYGWPSRHVAIIGSDLTAQEDALFLYWAQQWPELRAQASFASRIRVGGSGLPRIQTAQLASRAKNTDQITLSASTTEFPPEADWLPLIQNDALRPGRFRTFLQSYGPESKGGFEEVPKLARVFEMLSREPTSAEDFVLLMRTYPEQGSQRRLKSACLSKQGPEWPHAEESDRVLAALESRDAVDINGLEIPSRLLALAEDSPESFWKALRLALATDNPILEKELVSEFARSSAISGVTFKEIAADEPTFAAQIAASRPETLYEPDLWDEENRSAGLLRALAEDARAEVDQRLADALVKTNNDQLPSLGRKLGLISSAAIAEALGQCSSSSATLARFEALLGKDLDDTVEAQVSGAVPWTSVVLGAASSSRFAPQVTESRADVLIEHFLDLDRALKLIVATRLLAYGPKKLEGRAISVAFSTAHSALVRSKMPARLKRELDASLPGKSSLPTVVRLREALAQVIKKERWGQARIAATIDGAGDEIEDLADYFSKKSKQRERVDAALKGLS